MAFYTELLGRGPSAQFPEPPMTFFDVEGLRLMLDPKATSAIVYFSVDDVQAVIDRMRPRAQVLVEPRPLFTHQDGALGPAGHVEIQGEIADPEGNVVGLIGWKEAGPA
nr:methylmalonyl-CoA epimerase [Nesterenkonia ebinurensis]